MDDAEKILRGCLEPVVVDVGAYTGNWAKAVCGSFPKAKVYSVEADPKIFKSLVANTDGFNIIPIHAAITESDGEVEFYSASLGKSRLSQSNSLFKEYIGGKSWAKKVVVQQVKSRTLTSLCSEMSIGRIDLLKINCEGCEYKLFEADDLSFLKFTSNILLQLHGKNPLFASRRFGCCRKSIKHKLLDSGFELVDEKSVNILKGHTNQTWRKSDE